VGDGVNREEALAAFAAYTSDEDWPENIPPPYYEETIFLPPSLLEEIAATEVPPGVVVGVGTYRADNVIDILGRPVGT
jgi:hypothetical protein